MLKWGLFISGVVFLWGGIDNHLNYSTEINETAQLVRLDQLDDILKGKHPRYIKFVGELDATGKIYETYLDSPRFTGYRPREVNEVSVQQLFDAKTVENILGSTVKINLPLEGMHIEVQLIIEEGDSATLQSSSYIAPLMGANQKVWVLSPSFSGSSDSESKRKEWLQKRAHTGRLARLRDLNRNVGNLRKGVDEILTFYTSKSGRMAPVDALVILSNRQQMIEVDVIKIKYHTLVEDTGLKLFLHGSVKDQKEMIEDGVITGVLYPRESRYYHDFSRVLGEDSLPKRIGIVSNETASELNKDNSQATMIGIVGGLLMLSLWGFLIKRSFQNRRP